MLELRLEGPTRFKQLVALVDANYKFLYVNVGAAGRDGDARVFSNSSLKEALDDDSLNVPSPLTLEGTTNKLHHHIVGDDSFPLRVIMKPYPHRNLGKPKLIFNYRLSRARRVIKTLLAFCQTDLGCS